jgi:ribosome biogenesis protein Nip4
MKPLLRFVSQFGAQIALNPELVMEKDNRYYLLNPSMRPFAVGDFFYAGLYLGKVKNGLFFPSFNLLDMLVEVATNRVVLDRKAGWLFICGRDVFREGVLKFIGSKQKGEAVLVLNEYGECLGFGRLACGAVGSKGELAVKNVLDIGDFLRRERGF